MQHFGSITGVIYIGCILYILKRWGHTSNLTYSDHVATGPSRPLYVSVSVVAGSVFIAFVSLWLTRNTHIHTVFYVAAATVFAVEMIAALIPRVKQKVRTHDALAVAAGTLIQISIATLWFSQVFEGVLQVALLASVLYMFVMGPTLLFRNRPHYLYHQLVFHVLFLFWVSAAAYTS